MKKNSGFTLIELMVVMAIIAILALMASALFKNAQIKARNSKRVSDMKAIQKALEQCYDPEMDQYPGVTSSCVLSNLKGNEVPTDPKGGDYSITVSGTGYTITAPAWEDDGKTTTSPVFTQEQGSGT